MGREALLGVRHWLAGKTARQVWHAGHSRDRQCHPKANAVSDVTDSMLSDHGSSIDMHAARRSAAVWLRVSTLVPWRHPSASSFNWIVTHHFACPFLPCQCLSLISSNLISFMFILHLQVRRPQSFTATRMDCSLVSAVEPCGVTTRLTAVHLSDVQVNHLRAVKAVCVGCTSCCSPVPGNTQWQR